MVKKKTDQTTDIRKLITAKKVVIGTKQTITGLRQGIITRVLIAKNCDTKTKETLTYYQQLTNIDIIPLDVSNEDLGTICKKQFAISVLGIKK